MNKMRVMKQSNYRGEWEGGRGATTEQVIREGLSEKVTFRMRPE